MFDTWLNQYVQFEDTDQPKLLWFPSIDKELTLEITRIEYIRICGNISKHNPLGLDRQAKKVQQVFRLSKEEITLTQALLAIDDFYEQFNGSIFSYHSSSIVEFLNNIRLAIYEYLRVMHSKVIHYYRNEKSNVRRYLYRIPEEITNDYVRAIFWDLMNDMLQPTHLPRFWSCKTLKGRY